MTELLPCPFCGGRQTYRKHDGGVWLTTTNHKRGCIMRDALAFVAFNTEAEAIAAWNTRADDYKQAAAYWRRMYEEAFAERTCKFVSSKGSDYPPVCSACGYELGIYDCEWFEDGTYGYERNYCPNCGARVTKSDQDL